MNVSHPGSVEGSFSLSETRLAFWNRLSLLTQRLERQKGGDGEKLIAEIEEVLSFLKPIELYWAFPGKGALLELSTHLRERELSELRRGVGAIARALTSESYRYRPTHEILHGEGEEEEEKRGEEAKETSAQRHRPYFEVLIVDASSPREERLLREGLRHMRGADDAFLYDTVTVPSFEDALVACLFNFNIQAVLVRYAFDYRSANRSPAIKRFLAGLDDEDLALGDQDELSARLGQVLSDLRPELDLYLVADASVEDVVSAETHAFRRVFYRQDDYTDLHLTILRGIGERYETPFFTALKRYAKQPTGVFHALPISRGTSITRSHWIGDMVDFYGINIFLAETSATTGGLDSLLDPRGPIKRAQELAAKTFGAERTFFVTNGTSTANKIVVQAMLKPGDVVLVDRDCHKSHHYGFVLSGAQVSYLDSYPLRDFTIYGAVPTASILERLMAYKAEGRLDSVRMLLLTNCTFDGIVYNVEKVMEQALSIKPDLIFLWDEAWFAFAGFHPTYRQRTAMYVAEKLRRRYRSAAYRARYADWAAQYKDEVARDVARAKGEGLPDPEKVRIRVYATQSTHKTLTAFRQASMIHVRDQDFQGRVATAFHEAYMTHTSTSPNYQLLASLDLGRRQMALEGFELVQKQVERAMILREKAKVLPTIARHLRFLSMRDLIPAEHRQSGIEVYYDPARGWSGMEEAWAKDEFALDPTRLALFTGFTGIDGARFRGEVLMDRYAIQINKTSRNSVLFMTHIGTTRSAIAYLLKSLNDFSQREDQAMEEASAIERERHQARVQALTQDAPELPHFSGFHPAFRGKGGLPDGDIRGAFFLGYDDDNCSYLDITHLSDGEIDKLGGDLVSAMFVIPYPPGFPLLVPGQIVSADVVRYLRKLDVKEIHGYRADLGLRVFKKDALPKG